MGPIKIIWETTALDMPLGEFIQKLRDIQHDLLAIENSQTKVWVYDSGCEEDSVPTFAVYLELRTKS